MSDDNAPKFRPVNPLLGSRPSIGPIPADLLVPWGVIGLFLFVLCRNFLNLGWHWTGASIVWGCSSWWALTGSRPYRFLSKFIPVPQRWSRAVVRYRPMESMRVKRTR